MDKNEKLQALLNNEGLTEELEQIESYEQMQVWLTSHGVNLTMEEIYGLVAQLQNQSADELSANDLENVAGGCGCLPIIRIKLPIRIPYPIRPIPTPFPWRPIFLLKK